MKPAPQPWMKFYTSEHLIETASMSLAAQGLLVRAQCVIHQRGGIPKDQKAAAKLLNTDPRTLRALWSEVEPHLEDHPSIDGESTSNRVRLTVESQAILRAGHQLGAKKTNDSRTKKKDAERPLYREEKEKMYPHTPAAGEGKQGAQGSPEPLPLLVGSGTHQEEGDMAKQRSARVGGKLVELGALRPESREHFRRADAAWPPRSDQKASRGNKQVAEQLFQLIVDTGVLDSVKVTAEELASSATEVYLLEHPNVKSGFVQHMRTYFSPDTGEWQNCLRTLRERRAIAHAEKQALPAPLAGEVAGA